MNRFRFARQCRFASPVPPHPSPLPKERVTARPMLEQLAVQGLNARIHGIRGMLSPALSSRGGEGDTACCSF